MQDHPGAPGTARQESTRTIVSTNDGGKATQPRAPGHERPPAALSAARHGRLSAATGAPGADVPLASTAGAPGQHCLSAAPIATVSLPAGLRRLRQEVLPRVPATPNTLIYPQSHRGTAQPRATHSHCLIRRSRESGNPCPPVATGGPQGGYAPATCVAYSPTPGDAHSRSTTHQVHPAIQVLARPRSCSTTGTGFLIHPSRAPPTAGRRP